jgi:hypothetical protein
MVYALKGHAGATACAKNMDETNTKVLTSIAGIMPIMTR